MSSYLILRETVARHPDGPESETTNAAPEGTALAEDEVPTAKTLLAPADSSYPPIPGLLPKAPSRPVL